MAGLLRAPASYGHCLWSRMPAGYSGKPPCLPERKGEGDRAFPRADGPSSCPARGASRAAWPPVPCLTVLGVPASRPLPRSGATGTLGRSESMKKRLALVAAGAAVLLLAVAAPCAGRARGRRGRAVRLAAAAARRQVRPSVTNTAFHAWQAQARREGDGGRRQQDARRRHRRPHLHRHRPLAPGRAASTTAVPASFNGSSPPTAPGYNVVVTAMDGFTRHLHERRGRDAQERAGRRRPRERRRRSRSAPPRIKNDASPPGSPTGRSSWSPATPASSAAASRPASSASASSPRRTTLGADAGVPYGWLLQLRGAEAHADDELRVPGLAATSPA